MLPKELHEALAVNLDVSTTLVASYARKLREAGLITRNGRGASGARMVVRDAAMLLVAVSGSLAPSEAVAQIAAYDETRYSGGTPKGVLEALGLQVAGMSGSAAILRLMTAASDGTLDKVLEDAGVRPEYAAQAFEVSFVMDAPVRVQIRFSGYSGQSSREFAAYTPGGGRVPRMWLIRNLDGRVLVSLGRALIP